MNVTVIPFVIGALGTIPRGLVKRLENLGIRGLETTHLDCSIITIGQNTEKSPSDLRRLAVTCSNSSKRPSVNGDKQL